MRFILTPLRFLISGLYSFFGAILNRLNQPPVTQDAKSKLIKDEVENASKCIEEKIVAASDDALADIGNELLEKLGSGEANPKK